MSTNLELLEKLIKTSYDARGETQLAGEQSQKSTRCTRLSSINFDPPAGKETGDRWRWTRDGTWCVSFCEKRTAGWQTACLLRRNRRIATRGQLLLHFSASPSRVISDQMKRCGSGRYISYWRAFFSFRCVYREETSSKRGKWYARRTRDVGVGSNSISTESFRHFLAELTVSKTHTFLRFLLVKRTQESDDRNALCSHAFLPTWPIPFSPKSSQNRISTRPRHERSFAFSHIRCAQRFYHLTRS